MAKARKGASGAFLERSATEWRALGVPKRVYDVYLAVPPLGGPKLAILKALRADEVDRLHNIAAGNDDHRMAPDTAQRLLALYEKEKESEG